MKEKWRRRRGTSYEISWMLSEHYDDAVAVASICN